jgi:hypothetical protein
MVDRKTRMIISAAYDRAIGKVFGAGVRERHLNFEIEMARCGMCEPGGKRFCEVNESRCRKADNCKVLEDFKKWRRDIHID